MKRTLKHLLVALPLLLLAGMLATDEAWASKRMGGGRSVGQQRESVMQRAPAATPQAPTAIPQNAPAAAPRAAAPQATPAPAPKPAMSRWLAPLAGLAAGIGLAALFGHMGGSIATGLLMAVLVGIGVMLLMRVFAASRRPATAGAGNPWPAMGAETPAAPPPSQAMTQPIDAVTPAAAREPAIPAGFDVDGFLNQARHGFTTLYAAHDRGDLAMMREFTTDGMYAELRREIESRSGPVDPVKVITLEAELLEVVTEGSTHWASVRFSGMLSENASAPNEPFNEVWNLCQPVNGATGWLLAGIQQVN